MSTNSLYRRVCVKRPYWALKNLQQQEPGRISCDIPVQVRRFSETSAISLAEAGRHMAIAGLVATASTFDDIHRRYYLARTAVLAWEDESFSPPAKTVFCQAQGGMLTPTKASGRAALSLDGESIARGVFTYSVVSEGAFPRLAGNRQPDDTVDGVNPYRTPPLLRVIEERDTRLRVGFFVSPRGCAGHFPGFPMVPVAIQGSAVVQAIGILLRKMRGDGVRWRPRKVALTAQRLVPAGTHLVADVSWRDTIRGELCFEGTIYAKGSTSMKITVWLMCEEEKEGLQ